MVRGNSLRGERRARGHRWALAFVLAFAPMALTGCNDKGYDDLRRYVEKIKARKGGAVQPLPEFKTYRTFAYTGHDKRDPFKPVVSKASVVEAGPRTGDVQPNRSRHSEALEAFPLDSLSFVGHIEQNDAKWGVVSAPDGLVYRVSVGNHIGTNYGRIHAITEVGIHLIEIVPDGRGGWIEREAALKLAE